MRETPTLLLRNNKGADKPAQPGSLISAFVIHYRKSKVARSDISLIIRSPFYLVGFNMIKPLVTLLVSVLCPFLVVPWVGM